MKKIYTAAEVKAQDEKTLKNQNISLITLLERVGRNLYNLITSNHPNSSFFIVCGKGGNGSDGLVLAGLLKENGIKCDVYLPFGISTDIQSELIKKYKLNPVNNFIDSFDIVVDALFGSGFTGVINNNELLTKMNNSFVISIDIPSGLNADNGLINGQHIIAKETYIIEEKKLGNIINCGKDVSGKMYIVNCKLETISKAAESLELSDLPSFFPKRLENSNKGTYGRVCLIGGSKKFLGATILSEQALDALLFGVGYSELAIPADQSDTYTLRYPDITLNPLKSKNGFIKFNKHELDKIINSSNVITIGMGIGISRDIYKIIKYLLINYKHTLIIDADGLNTIAKYGIDVLMSHKCHVVLLPHLMEFQRLTNINIEKIKANSFNLAKSFAKYYNVTINLKSSVSIITNGYKTYINDCGNNSLAKGGSGDVLAGITSGMVSIKNNYEIIDNVAAAAFLLGYTAECLTDEYSNYAIIPSDITKKLKEIISTLCKH